MYTGNIIGRNNVYNYEREWHLKRLSRQLTAFGIAYSELLDCFEESKKYGEGLHDWEMDAICEDYPFLISFDEIDLGTWIETMITKIDGKIDELHKHDPYPFFDDTFPFTKETKGEN